MSGAFDGLVRAIGAELDQRADARKLRALRDNIDAGAARSKRRNRVLLKSLADTVAVSQAQMREQRILDRELQRKRIVQKFEFAQEEFAKAIASGELVGEEISKWELWLQYRGEEISRL